MTQTPTLLFVALSVLPLASSLFFPELLLSTSLLNPNPTFIPQPSLPSLTLSSSYATFTPAQTTFASAWRILDNTFTDRTFNGQDWFATRQKYLKTVNDDNLSQTLTFLTSSLNDKYTTYLPPSKYNSLISSATGSVTGIGVTLSTPEPEIVKILQVQPGSPAEKVGLKKSMILKRVDGYEVKDADVCGGYLRGEKGTKVGVTVSEEGRERDFIIVRDTFKPVTVTAESSNGIRVLKIKSFAGTTKDEVLKGLNNMESGKILIDLRGNPGGLLPGGIDVAGLFLKEGDVIVSQVDKTNIKRTEKTLFDGEYSDPRKYPLEIIGDGNTASAAEVFTAAIVENGRGRLTIVGGKHTFGKGVVQTVRPLEGGGGIKVTVAKYLTPEGNDINKEGILGEGFKEECGEESVLCLETVKAWKMKVEE